MEKTAVEWLEEKITKNDCADLPMYIYNFIEQAIEMENEQRKNDFRAGWHGNKHKSWNCEFYLIKHMNNNL